MRRSAARNPARRIPGIVLEAAVAPSCERRVATAREGRLVVLEDREAVFACGGEHEEVVEDLRVPRQGVSVVDFCEMRRVHYCVMVDEYGLVQPIVVLGDEGNGAFRIAPEDIEADFRVLELAGASVDSSGDRAAAVEDV